MTTLFSLKNGIDVNGNNIGLRNPSGYIDGLSLAADTAERVAIPTGAKRVVFGTEADIAVKLGSSSVVAAMPTDITDGSGSDLNPNGYLLDELPAGTTHISIISSSASRVSLAWYAK